MSSRHAIKFLPSADELNILMGLMDTHHKGFVNAADLHRIAGFKDPILGIEPPEEPKNSHRKETEELKENIVEEEPDA